VDKRASDGPTARFPIGELSRRANVSAETVRYYEREGLLPLPPRTYGGHRVYAEEHLLRLKFIRRTRTLGFTLSETRALLDLSEKRDGACAEVRNLALAHLADVRSKIATLQSMERTLDQVTHRCSAEDQSGCPLIDTLFEVNAVPPIV
jgi:MerR family transcriptional regulator, mercuric resistance operon regulatory protein